MKLKLKLRPILELLSESDALVRATGSTFVEKWANVTNVLSYKYFIWRLADLHYGAECEAVKLSDAMYAASRQLNIPLTVEHFRVPGYAERVQRVVVEWAVKNNCAIPAGEEDEEATIDANP